MPNAGDLAPVVICAAGCALRRAASASAPPPLRPRAFLRRRLGPPRWTQRRRPGNSSTCWWCGCHPVSAARGQSIDRTRAAARHDHGSLRAHGTRPLAACVGIGACLQHLVGEPRTCCGHLPSGTGSRSVRETRDEQRSGELAAAHPHMRLGSWPVRMQSGSNVRDSGRLKESLQVGRQRSGHRVRRRPGQGAS